MAELEILKNVQGKDRERFEGYLNKGWETKKELC